LANICSYGTVNGRGFTTEEKQCLVAASFASGLSVRDFAADHGIGYSTLNKWRRRYGKPTDPGPGSVPVAVMDNQKVAGIRRNIGKSIPLLCKRLTTATLRMRVKDRILGARGSGVSEQLRKSGFGRHM
jgi:transposase-like protein